MTVEGFKEGFVETNGIQMHYVFAGTGSPVILLHGFPEHWYSWRHQIRALSEAGLCAIAPDLRGFGKTDKPDDGYDTNTLVKDISGLADGLGLKQFSVVGHDWGGPIAWLCAMHVPGVERLAVANGPHPGIYAQNLVTTTQFFRSWYIYLFQIPGVAERLLRRDNYRFIRAMFKDGQRRAPESITDDDIDKLVDAIKAPRALKSGLQYYRQNFWQNPAETWRKIKKVSVPTSITWGMKDQALVPDTRKKLERWVDAPLDLHIIEDAGHWIQQERPDEVNRILIEFLQKKPVSAQH